LEIVRGEMMLQKGEIVRGERIFRRVKTFNRFSGSRLLVLRGFLWQFRISGARWVSVACKLSG